MNAARVRELLTAHGIPAGADAVQIMERLRSNSDG